MLILLSQAYSAKVAKGTSGEIQDYQNELQGLRFAREAVTLARRLKGKHHLPWALYALAESHLVGRRGEDALRTAKEASSCTDHDRSGQALCLMLIAEAHFLCNSISAALDAANEALSAFSELGDEAGASQARDAMERFQKPSSTGAP